MQKYQIYAGINGASLIDTDFFPSQQVAMNYAYQQACEEYNKSIGRRFNGSKIRSVRTIMNEDAVYEEEAKEIFLEERENYISYTVKLVK